MLTASGASWIRFSLVGLLGMLDQRYGDLGILAEQYWRLVVQPHLANRMLVSAVSGTNYTETACFRERQVLALQLFFDGLCTVQNALGHAAVTSRKYYVFSVRVANTAVSARDSDCILPLCIVPPDAWSDLGFDGVINEIAPEFERLKEGTHWCCSVDLHAYILSQALWFRSVVRASICCNCMSAHTCMNVYTDAWWCMCRSVAERRSAASSSISSRTACRQ